MHGPTVECRDVTPLPHVYEAKYTLGFDEAQLVRTRRIAEVWAELLYEDLGFSDTATVHVRTLGLGR